jgi:flavin reductase (DIM6/NTAB) family NADH-FMN oxidoreductase RutF
MRSNFKPGTLHAPLPAVMATVGDMENSNIITVAWTGILSSDPARTYISVRPSRYSHKLLSETKEFVINLTTEALAYATDYAGIYTGAKVDKFEKLGLTKAKSAEVSAPTIAESPLALECRVFEVLHFGTHDVFMADIVNVSCDDSILDSNGKICFEKAGLMAYAHGEYYAIGEKIGKFGFSAAKTQEAKRYVERSKRKLDAGRKGAVSVNARKTEKSHPVSNKTHYVKGGQKREKPGKR